jgi:hypothetical protein
VFGALMAGARRADLHPSRNRAWGPAAVQIRVIGSPLPTDVEDAAKALAESEPEVIIHLVPAGQMIEHAPLLLRYQLTGLTLTSGSPMEHAAFQVAIEEAASKTGGDSPHYGSANLRNPPPAAGGI